MTPIGYSSFEEAPPQPTHDYRTVAEVFERPDHKWEWRLKSLHNGQIVAVSGGQGFDHKDDATKAVMKLGEWADRIQEVRYA